MPDVPRQSPLAIETDETDGRESQLDRQNRVLFGIGSIVAAGVLAVTGFVGFTSYRGMIKPQPSPGAALPKPTATPEPTPVIARGAVVIDVLNGSGKSGMAARAARKLEALGYTIGTVANAPAKSTASAEFTYTGNPGLLPVIQTDLDGIFGQVVPGIPRTGSSSASGILVVGAAADIAK